MTVDRAVLEAAAKAVTKEARAGRAHWEASPAFSAWIEAASPRDR